MPVQSAWSRRDSLIDIRQQFIMMQGQQFQTMAYSSPLFQNCYQACPFSQSSSAKYLVLPGQLADDTIFTPDSGRFLCPSFSNPDKECCFILLEGGSLHKYILSKSTQDRDVIMTEQQIWNLVFCLTEAFNALLEAGCSHKLTHLKQYSIRKISDKDTYKLIYHQSMISQLSTAQSRKWTSVYLSPEELCNEFVPEKSIVFSLGVMLLNLCAFRDRERTIYHLSKFQVDEQVVREKLQLAERVNGYSRLLCNFIEQCLVLDHHERHGFAEIRMFLARKLEKCFARQSQLVSQVARLTQTGVLKYDLTLPRHSEVGAGYHKISKRQGYQKEASQLQSSLEREPIKQQSQVDKKALKKKKSTKFQNLNRKKSTNKIAEKVQDTGPQHPMYRNIEYRGTFGDRHVVENEQQQDAVVKRIKRSQPDNIKQDQEQQIESQQYVEMRQNNFMTQAPQPMDIKIRIQPKQTQLKISITQNEILPENKQQPETPKGFVRQKVNNKGESYEANQEQQTFPELMTHMELLVLEECLLPKQQLIRKLNVMGVWVDGDIFYGAYESGRREGLGLQIFSNNDYYYGHFREDMFSGEGFYCWANGDHFFGWFELGQKIQGRFDGQIKYQGGFRDNKRHGQGTCWYPSGEIYSGEWVHGRKDGKGTFQLYEGCRFTGIWRKGRRHGEGELVEDDKKICGFWNDQVIEGQALISYENGDLFKGLLDQNLQKLQGFYISKSGRTFKGTFENDQPRKGELVYSNKDRYSGELLNNKRHGYGEYTYYETGEVYRGRWQHGVREH